MPPHAAIAGGGRRPAEARLEAPAGDLAARGVSRTAGSGFNASSGEGYSSFAAKPKALAGSEAGFNIASRFRLAELAARFDVASRFRLAELAARFDVASRSVGGPGRRTAGDRVLTAHESAMQPNIPPLFAEDRTVLAVNEAGWIALNASLAFIRQVAGRHEFAARAAARPLART